MSLLSVAPSGAGQMRAITLWGAASAAGAAAGPLVGGVLVDVTGWQGLFWIDAAIAAACIPLTLRHRAGVARSEPAALDRLRRHGADRRRSSLRWCSRSARAATGAGRPRPTLGCFVVSVRRRPSRSCVVERRVAAPLVDLQLLRNRGPGRRDPGAS